MTRIPLIDPATATGAAAEQLDATQQAMGAVPNMARAMVNSPAALKGYLGLSGALGKGVLRNATRERLALAIAESNECAYCLSVHTYTGEHAAKLDEEDILAAREGSAVDPKENAILTFALAVNASRGDIADADFEAARTAGLSDAEIVEVIGAVGLNSLTNFFNKAMQTDIDFPVVLPGTAGNVDAA
ncbi:carboxymuconolactone decarboxylase family protein [Salinibacterium sp. ZJ450]|uniref:carboxymuconolactone decarboxylase family protein n=1 Tax=Salinibacterium sp. ZJ450 TaxID=2708338 RepID=UPI00142282C9|nr:carboxymuconolactone decarboxylase family protein [Salinibacterium sp. ZJ450]